MAKNSLEESIQYLGLSFKKEMIKLVTYNVVILLMCFGMYLFMKNTVVIILGVAFIGGIDAFLLTSYSRRKSFLNYKRAEEFISLISYFQTFVSNHCNVYQSFTKLKDYSSDWMKTQLDIFLNNIDVDKSVKPYIEFSEVFKLPIARNIMLSIYQMIDEGESEEQMNQFTFLLTIMNQQHSEQLKDKKERSLSSVSTYPMVGAGILMLSLSMGVLSSVGDVIHVI